MIVDLDSFEGPEQKFSFEVAAADLDLSDEAARPVGTFKVSGSVFNTPQFEVQGRIEGLLELDCTRCLCPVPFPIDIAFDDVFVDPVEMSSSEERELSPSDMRADALSDRRIDLLEAAREQILLSLPTQFFCKEDCRGLCDRCGADLNRASCDCRADDVDPRWAALKDLKKKTE